MTLLSRRLGPLALTLALTGLAGCSGDAEAPDATPTTSAATAPARATPAPAPRAKACYRLDFEAALEPTTEASPVSCRSRHTVTTLYVGRSTVVVGGHLLAVDSVRAQRLVQQTCSARFARDLGGSTEDRRLSMLTPVWFGPTLAESDAGEAWFRCDVVALAGPEQLAPLARSMRGALATAAGRDRWGRCATARPGTAGAEHVLCSTDDAWRAVATIDVPAGRQGAWPGRRKAAAAGSRCEDEVRPLADDPLKFTWGYEPPDAGQWAAGRHYGFCWMPG